MLIAIGQVIGIMDCQEWKDTDLSEGYKQFAQSLGQVRTKEARNQPMIHLYALVPNRYCNQVLCI
jgi:hypothetical protein